MKRLLAYLFIVLGLGLVVSVNSWAQIKLQLDKEVKAKKTSTKSEVALEVGTLLGQRAKEKKVKKIVFDKNGYKYHGRIKALADSVRKEGVQF